MQWYVDQEILPCANTLVMRGLDVLDYKCFGYMDLESKTPLREDAIFRMHSSTKMITSVALMTLYEQGKFGLDDALADYISVFANPKVLIPNATAMDQTEDAKSPITIRQVLSHSAGFSYGFVEPESMIDKAYVAGGLNILGAFDGDLEILVNKLAEFPLVFQPGSNWRYSLATDVAARLVEVLSGQRFDEYVKAVILKPLGMLDTDFYVESDNLERLVTLAMPNDPFKPMNSGITQLGKLGKGPTKAPSFLSGGGGLFSTVADYLSFIRMLINDGEWQGVRILQKETLDLMRSNQLNDGVSVQFPTWKMPGTVFGLGFALKAELSADEPAGALGEYHWGGLAGTHLWMSPSGTSGICMTQLMPGFWHQFSH
ncbi:MAG: CubicO group peptidase (beta-lactamase class C family), partial [Gammaproteobacteria bacterium]